MHSGDRYAFSLCDLNHDNRRIAAIRETFEESGVLLLQPDDSGRAPLLEASEWMRCPLVKKVKTFDPQKRQLSGD